ncbi:hypothetical protein [Campylobacter pinnipediorum]|uniref:hypothetical protein n=1 Tax=Campylobacter pinnipediorum TaxID=1965231 RepID=UPI0009954207|nr:hypothetical protein [Campylobacter pinnipediorum]AQW81426.1 hypothetical protein CPIN17260_1139 [Campylobacter pinnipediorum subsp. pinnipediorum]AQW83054.1 hypothetical protein CPIN17261_1051 [Campylobacter pinnipediorum subsp. pinnipediorum]AQW84622.1 hypothetical protein CPIN17262_0944 [Campylobacter pinnipediorum subsp. pinnipediorum]
MISSIQKIQKITNDKISTISLNTSLPVSLFVSEKISFNRYILKFRNKELVTKSAKRLKVGAKYWGEIKSASDNIVINNLYEKPDFLDCGLENGIFLIERLVSEEDIKWLYEEIIKNLSSNINKDEFEIYTNILLALNQNIIHIPFIYNDNFNLFQFKKDKNKAYMYLVFLNFAPLLFEFVDGNLDTIKTPFQKVSSVLKEHFSCKIENCDIDAIWKKNKNLIDFKG